MVTLKIKSVDFELIKKGVQTAIVLKKTNNIVVGGVIKLVNKDASVLLPGLKKNRNYAIQKNITCILSIPKSTTNVVCCIS